MRSCLPSLVSKFVHLAPCLQVVTFSHPARLTYPRVMALCASGQSLRCFPAHLANTCKPTRRRGTSSNVLPDSLWRTLHQKCCYVKFKRPTTDFKDLPSHTTVTCEDSMHRLAQGVTKRFSKLEFSQRRPPFLTN